MYYIILYKLYLYLDKRNNNKMRKEKFLRIEDKKGKEIYFFIFEIDKA